MRCSKKWDECVSSEPVRLELLIVAMFAKKRIGAPSAAMLIRLPFGRTARVPCSVTATNQPSDWSVVD